MPGLFDPAAIGSLHLANRFVRSATAECMAGQDGEATPRLFSLYSRLASGNIGLIITGGAFVHPSGRSYVGVLGVHKDSAVQALSPLTDAVHQRDSKIVLQLYHCGRQGEPEAAGGTLLAPSPVSDRIVRSKPKAMSESDIWMVVSSFADAAGRAKMAGFDGVQILAANGYLINQFLSPHTNRRTDEWGGSLANRARFLLEVVRAVRAAVGSEFPILVKLTVNDFVRGGLLPEQSFAVAQMLDASGIDAIEVTGGTLESFFYMSRGEIPIDQMLQARLIASRSRVVRQLIRAVATTMRGRVKFEEAYFAQHAEQIKQKVHVPVMLVGGLRSPVVMERLLQEEKTDFVCMARPFLREPHVVRRFQLGDLRPSSCLSCNRCLVSVADGAGVHCFGGKR
jgi:2,4-dienoyl-CoA reductase-like NADH-dependent reductase (Old Yellow Enzyme family)